MLITMSQKDHCFVLHLSQSLFMATVAAGVSTAFDVHHGVVRHGNSTSVRDVVLGSFLVALCRSISLRFNDYVLRILL